MISIKKVGDSSYDITLNEVVVRTNNYLKVRELFTPYGDLLDTINTVFKVWYFIHTQDYVMFSYAGVTVLSDDIQKLIFSVYEDALAKGN